MESDLDPAAPALTLSSKFCLAYASKAWAVKKAKFKKSDPATDKKAQLRLLISGLYSILNNRLPTFSVIARGELTIPLPTTIIEQSRWSPKQQRSQ